LLEWLDWSYPVLQQHFEIRTGQVHVPEVPGIGIEWDEKAVAANLM
jgi:mandelate racemase